MIAEYDQDGELVWNYVYGLGQRVARYNGSNKQIYHNDHLGNMRAITDTVGSGTIAKADYYPCGEMLSITGSPGRFTYNGNELDDEYGFDLYYYGARYMDPASGRFITPDPIKDFYNPYSYAHNNPMNRIDPTGMWSPPIHQYGSCTGYEFLKGMDPFGWIDDRSVEFLAHKANQMDVESWRNEILAKERQNATKSSDETEKIKNQYWYSPGQDQTQYTDPNFIGPVERPDADGYLTVAEVKWWREHGGGADLHVDFGKIDLSLVSYHDLLDENGNLMLKTPINLLSSDYYSNWNDAHVYGNITLFTNDGYTVWAEYDDFDFDFHWELSRDAFERNIKTVLGRAYYGWFGDDFRVYFYGTQIIWGP